MRRLTVEEFSCIDSADLELRRLTVLVGPQASGKSVLAKLTYFFLSLLHEQYLLLEDAQTFESFKDYIRERFREWFPVSAWGPRKFRIEFAAGPFEIRLTRVEYKGALSENIRVWISPFFEEHYQNLLEQFNTALRKARSLEPGSTIELSWKIRDTSERVLVKALGRDYVGGQLFIPAGRAFFTSIGKAVSVFEHGGLLDPLTIRFGRFYARVRERRYLNPRRERPTRKLIHDLMAELFGGQVRHERDKEYVELKDGRRIPFSALSSGQQELLPLLEGIEYASGDSSRLMHIEEPEAHLFPSAQSRLVEALAQLTYLNKGTDLLLTTHSPYVLAKFNNLIKAGELFQQRGEAVNAKLSDLLPRESWLAPGDVNAYALRERRLTRLIDADGLIDAEYLDEVSGTIAREFSALVAIEAA